MAKKDNHNNQISVQYLKYHEREVEYFEKEIETEFILQRAIKRSMVSCLCEIENNKRGKQEFVDTLFENDELDQELIDLAEQIEEKKKELDCQTLDEGILKNSRLNTLVEFEKKKLASTIQKNKQLEDELQRLKKEFYYLSEYQEKLHQV